MKKYLLIILLALFALPAKAIDYIDDDTVYEVMNNLTLRRPLVIEMWSDNCPGSRVVAPRFAEVARRYSSQAYFYKLDVSEYPSVINTSASICCPASLPYTTTTTKTAN